MNTQEHAKNIRKNIIKMVGAAGSGHPGGSLSMTDIVSVLYFEVLNIDPKNPKWENRDRLVLSKGHAAPGLYAALAERGYYDEEELLSLRKFGSKFQGHPRSEEHTSELQSRQYLVCRLLLEKKKQK